MAVRITPPGGRVRRKGGAVSLAGGDVPTVTPARDPGVNIPLIPIPVDNTLGTAGAGLQAIGDILGEGSDLALKMVRRDEGLARNADETSYSDKLQDTIRDLQATADLSDRAVVEAVGQQMIEEQERILSEHKGGETSKRLLTNRLIKLRNSFADTLAVLNINAADVRLKGVVDKKISSITQDVLANPDVLISSDPLEAFRFHVGQLEEEIDFLELRPDQARVVRQAGQSEIALSMITPLIKNGQFDRAKALLRSDEIGKVLSPGQQRDAVQRIIDSERKLDEVNSEGKQFLTTARLLAPANSSEEQIRGLARELAGIEVDGNVDIINIGGGKVIAVDKDTLEVQTLVAGPTAEEAARLEGAIEKAKLLARKDVLGSMAIEAGLGELFAIPSTETTSGGEDTSKSTKPAPAKEGEEDAPTGPEVVPPLPEEAVSLPFGPEEPPASNDMQSVLGLMALSRRFLLIGDNGSANALLSQARMIIENSREIQGQRELDKSITNLDILRELGMPLGATMRQAQGKILRSSEELKVSQQRGETISLNTAREFQVPPNSTQGELDAILSDRERSGEGSAIPRTFEEKTEAGSLASARGRNQAQAEVQMRFVFETDQQINDILEEIEDDTTLVGTVGALRATGRTALTLLADFGFDDFVDAARNLASDQSDLGADEIFKLFDDPLLSALDLLSNSIGINRARLRNPVGRVPVEIIKRSIKDSDLTKFGGSDKIVDVLDRIRKDELGRRRNVLKKQFPGMFDPFENEEEGGASEEQDIPSDIPRFRIDLKTNKLVPVEE